MKMKVSINKDDFTYIKNIGQSKYVQYGLAEQEDGGCTCMREFVGRSPLSSDAVLDIAFRGGASLSDIQGLASELKVGDEALLAKVKGYAETLISDYDTSEAVNGFTIGGKQMWLDKATRVGLANSVTIEKNAGREETVLWFGGEQYALPVDTALQMLSALELYALECYNQTQKHLAAVSALETADEVVGYDYTAGYPEKLEFTV